MEFFDFHHHNVNKLGIFNRYFIKDVDYPYFSIGLHPMDIDENWEKNWEKIKVLSQHQNCVAIGECGLDSLVKADLNLQKEVFTRQILWANEIKKPVVIHCVRLYHELYFFSKIAKTPLIVHGFNKNSTIAHTLLDKGFYLSFGKAVLYRVYLQELIKEVPMEKFFLETDDEDFDIKDLYDKVAELRGISIEELILQIEKNKERVLYGK